MPTISVIVPVYKVEPYLRKCVDSILGQTFRDFELILVDDGSPDGCPEICDKYAEKDSRVKVIHKENGGLSSARNAGLDVAKGEYIAFVDSDDWINPEMLEIMQNRMQQHHADVAICGVESVYEDDGKIVHHPLTDAVLSRDDMVDKLATQAWYYIIACNKLYCKKIFEELRYPEGYIHEDAAIIHRIIGLCKCVVTVEQPFYNYRQTGNSIMRSELNIRRTDNLSSLADRICYSYDRKWHDVFSVTAERYVHTFFDYYFRFFRSEENEKYFRRMDESLKKALPYILKSGRVSLRHKIYLSVIRLNPKIYSVLKRLLKK